jgi:hypothetical protein
MRIPEDSPEIKQIQCSLINELFGGPS